MTEKIEFLPPPDMSEVDKLLRTVEAQIAIAFGTMIFRASDDGKLGIIPVQDFYKSADDEPESEASAK